MKGKRKMENIGAVTGHDQHTSVLLAVCINPYFDSPAAISTWQAPHLVPLSFTATAHCDSFPKQRPQRASSRHHVSAPSSKEELTALTAVPTAVAIKKQWRLKTRDFLLLVPCRGHQSSTEITGRCPWGLPQSSTPWCHAQDNPTVVSAHALCHTLLPRGCLVGFSQTLFVFRLAASVFQREEFFLWATPSNLKV